ncbi:voltage-gated potassium channel [Aureococcus anophagefferens]|nr:voltage-gated potassium channel [Aureococcus anophagefferens]
MPDDATLPPRGGAAILPPLTNEPRWDPQPVPSPAVYALADVSDDAAAALRAACARSLAERLAAPPRTDAARARSRPVAGHVPAYPDHDADGAERADAPASDSAAASETKAAEAGGGGPGGEDAEDAQGRVVPVDSSPKKTPPSTPNGTWRSAAVVTSSRRVQRRKRHRERLKERYQSIDTNGDGEITRDEFTDAMCHGGLTKREARRVFSERDENGDGTMDQSEFISLLESKHPILMRIAWVRELEKGFHDGEDDEKIAALDVDAGRRPVFMLSPNDRSRVSWDCVTACLLVYVAIIEPMRLGFDIDPAPWSFVFVLDWICDVFFIADFLLNFRTGYVRDTGDVDLDPKRSALYYLQTWALLDFVSTIPPLLEFFAGSGMRALRSAKVLKLARIGKIGRMLKMSKIFRLAKALKFGEKFRNSPMGDFLEDFFASSQTKAMQRILYVLVKFGFLAHYLGCFFSVAGESHLREYAPGNAKAGGKGADEWSLRARYLASFYWAVTTMTTVGYGDITPVTDRERVTAVVAMVVGGFSFAYIVAQMTVIVRAYDAHMEPYQQKMDRVYAWLSYYDVPPAVRRHVRRYYRTYFAHRTAFDERSIVEDLDPDSQKLVADYVLPSCVRHNDLFAPLPRGAICKILHFMRWMKFEPEARVVGEGDKCSTMFIIYTGKCWISRSRGTKTMAHPGESFGEKAVLGVSSWSELTATALTPLEVIALTQNDFMQAFVTLPEALVAMRHGISADLGLAAPMPTTFTHLTDARREVDVDKAALSPTPPEPRRVLDG